MKSEDWAIVDAILRRIQVLHVDLLANHTVLDLLARRQTDKEQLLLPRLKTFSWDESFQPRHYYGTECVTHEMSTKKATVRAWIIKITIAMSTNAIAARPLSPRSYTSLRRVNRTVHMITHRKSVSGQCGQRNVVQANILVDKCWILVMD